MYGRGFDRHRLRLALPARTRRALSDWLAIAGVATAGGWLCAGAGLPAPWLIGSLSGGMLLALFTRRPWHVPGGARVVAQILLGLAVGLTLRPDTLSGLGARLPALLLLVGGTMGLSMLNGFVLWRWCGVDRLSGFLGCVPGAAGAMVVMSHDLGADARLVAVLQYLRVLLVALLAPIVVEHLVPFVPAAGAPPAGVVLTEGPPATPADPAPADPGPSAPGRDLALLGAYAVLGVGLGRLFHLPSGTFLGPFLVVVAVSFVSPAPPTFPAVAFDAVLVVMGAWIGVQFDLPLIRRLGRVALAGLLLSLGLILGSALLGYLFSLATGVGLATAFLGSAPGAMEALVAAAVELGADAPVVIAMQMSRFLIMLVAGPSLARRLAGVPPGKGPAPPSPARGDRIYRPRRAGGGPAGSEYHH